MPATVRISDSGRTLLAQLAKEAETSMTAVLDVALENYRRHRFLTQASEAYERELVDASSTAGYRNELAELDGTTADGLDTYAS